MDESKYYVITIKPFTNKSSIIEANDYEEAKEIATNQYLKKKNDVLIVKKNENGYEIQNFGYFKTYKFLNNLFLILSFMLLLLISYLYYKFLNLKK